MRFRLLARIPFGFPDSGGDFLGQVAFEGGQKVSAGLVMAHP